MTTATFDTNHLQTWKVLTVCMAVFAAILVVAIGVESYFFYRAYHWEAAPVAPPALAPAIPHSGVPTVKLPALPEDDLGFFDAPFVGGSAWDQMNHLHQQMDQLFNDTFSRIPMDGAAMLSAVSSPNLDIREDKDHYIVRVDMPGASKDSIKINIEGGRLLTISGERSTTNESKESGKVVQTERSLAEFVRTVELPGPVKAGAVDAKYDNGVLSLTLPKADQPESGTQVPVH